MAGIWWTLLEIDGWVAEILVGLDREMRSGARDEDTERGRLRSEKRLRRRWTRRKQLRTQKRRGEKQ